MNQQDIYPWIMTRNKRGLRNVDAEKTYLARPKNIYILSKVPSLDSNNS